MPRATKSEVKQTFDADFESETGDSDDISDASVDQWISIAEDKVDEIANADSSIESSKLTNIEILVAQHYLATQAQRVSSISGASRSADYQGDTGMGFEGTKYGQAALSLDPTGVLASSTKPTASLTVDSIKKI